MAAPGNEEKRGAGFAEPIYRSLGGRVRSVGMRWAGKGRAWGGTLFVCAEILCVFRGGFCVCSYEWIYI